METTVAGCTEMSSNAVVDGWVFLLPFVINGGEFNFVNGVFEVCLNDTITFELGPPYDTNIQWTADGIPIANETNSIFKITSSDATEIINYNVCGSPNICPN